MSTAPKVSVGPTTYATAVGTLAGFLLAIYAYAQGDRTAGTVTAIVSGVAFAIMQIGRYAQAYALAKIKPTSGAPIGAAMTSSGTGTGATTFVTGSQTENTDGEGLDDQDPVEDDEELQAVPIQQSAAKPEAPEGEPPGGRGETPPLEPGDFTEG